MGGVEAHWLRDRGNLVACNERKKAVQDYYANRDKALLGKNRR